MPRGNPDNLRAAAQRKREAATQRAETALNELIASREPITFRGLAKTAGVSIDFLYRSPLRARVEQLLGCCFKTRSETLGLLLVVRPIYVVNQITGRTT